MMTVTDIEAAVAGLEPGEFAAFQRWFEAFAVDRFDARIVEDGALGRLDGLADEALSDHRLGDVRPV